MNIKEVKKGSFIYTVDDVLTKDECEQIINLYSNDNIEIKRSGIGEADGIRLDANVRDNGIIMLSEFVDNVEDAKKVDDILFNSLSNVIHEFTNTMYGSEYNGLGFANDHGYQLLEYDKGEHYTWHIDMSGKPEVFGVRELSCVWYLNTLTEEEGGSTDFLKQDVSVQPTQGQMLIFPSFWTHVHRSSPVLTDTTKYAAVTWFDR